MLSISLQREIYQDLSSQVSYFTTVSMKISVSDAHMQNGNYLDKLKLYLLMPVIVLFPHDDKPTILLLIKAHQSTNRS